VHSSRPVDGPSAHTPAPRNVLSDVPQPCLLPDGAPVAAPVSLSELVSLLRADQRRCWERGQRVWAEDYLERYPALRGAVEAVLDLLYSEFLLREERGDQPRAEEYLGRFPEYEVALRRQLALHEELVAGRLPPTVLQVPAAGQPLAEEGKSEPDGARAVCTLRPRPAAATAARLSCSDSPGPALETAWWGLTGTAPPEGMAADRSPVSGYEILGLLGKGGMGVVYKARQVGLNRIVALKTMLDSDHAEAAVRDRFRTEAEAVARLQHPHVVQIYEVGEDQGTPFFSLEFCAGGSLAEKLAGGPLPPMEAAGLVEILAGALQAAHDRHLVHRDLKPANVLLTEDGIPKVTDFGLVKKLDEVGQTMSGAIVGTPCYMAPEQASGTREIGPLADIYALGAILYECLTGRPPFKAATPMDIVLQVLHEEPVPPRRLNPQVPRDLETVCLLCLRKEPGRRYGSARALADDLARFLRGEPIRARRAGRAERAWRWCQRNPAVASLAAAVAALLVAMAAGASLEAVRFRALAEQATSARDEAQRSAGESRERLVRQYTAGGARLLDEGDYFGALPWFAEAQRLDHDRAEAQQMHGQRTAAVLGSCPRLSQVWFHDAVITYAAFSPDGRRVVTPGEDCSARVWDRATGESVTPPLQHRRPVRQALFSPDGRLVVTAAGEGGVWVWDAESGRRLCGPLGHGGRAVFSPDGRRVITSGDGPAQLWDAHTGQSLLRLGTDTPALCASFSPDGRRVLTCGGAGACVWDSATGKLLVGSLQHEAKAEQACYSPDGRHILTTGADRTARLWAADTGRALTPPLSHPDVIRHAAFAPDGRRVLTCAGEQVWLWDAHTGQLVRPPLQHIAGVWHGAFSPDGRFLAAVGCNITLMWDADGTRVGPSLTHSGLVGEVSFSPDGRFLLVVGGQSVQLWDRTADQSLHLSLPHAGAVWRGSFSPDGRHILTGSWDGTARIWDAATGAPAAPPLTHRGAVRQAFFSPDGRRILTTSTDHTARVWDRATGRPLTPPLKHASPVYHAAFSPDGGRVATASADSTACVWEADTGRPLTPLLRHKSSLEHVAFDPDGKRIVTACADGTASVWQVATGERILWARPHTGWLHHVSFSPDGQRILTASADRTARLLDAATGEPIGRPLEHTASIYLALFSPDGRRILTASSDRTARLWDAATGAPATPSLQHGGLVCRAAFSPDGLLVVTASADRTARVWEAATGAPLTPPLQHPDEVMSAAFSPDGRRVVTGCRDGRGRVWEVAQGPLPPAHDLTRLAELLAKRRLDPSGGLVPLESEELHRAWQDLRPRCPELFDTSAPEVSAWHRRQAWDCVRDRDWHGAAGHLDALLAAGPTSSTDYASRGRARAELGQWDEAAADYRLVLERGCDDPDVWFGHALLCLATGDSVGHRRACEALLRGARAGNPYTAQQAVRACVVGPSLVGDPACVLQLAEQATGVCPPDSTRADLVGAALYRAGRAKEALRRFQEVYEPSGQGGTAGDALFQAMALYAVGHAGAADTLGSNTGGRGADPDSPSLTWEQRLELRLLRRQARAMLWGGTMVHTQK
jgi:WD40 repeat protein/tetratricopeptide (TPR) repeat protein/tRNA A-37 threonylcarbamoyl transferase component Bud32